jgi:hypothetical protein
LPEIAIHFAEDFYSGAAVPAKKKAAASKMQQPVTCPGIEPGFTP